MVKMKDQERSLIQEFFGYYPDYLLCRTLAFNVESNVTTHEQALEILVKKAGAAQQNQDYIEEKLALQKVSIDGKFILIRDLSLKQIVHGSDDKALREILGFYFKHPYAHSRTKRTWLLPRWIRTFFLGALIGHAQSRGLDLDYGAYFEMLKML